MLWSIIYCSSHHCLRSITTQDWCLWVLRSAGERDRHPGCNIVDIDKFGTKYSMHKIAHAKHWELHTSSSEGCTAYWNMNRQTDRMKGQIFVSKAGLNDSNQCYQNELHCVCCAQWKFTLNQLTDRIKLLLAVPQMKVNNLERNIQCTSLSWNYISHVFLGPMVDFWTRCNNLIS